MEQFEAGFYKPELLRLKGELSLLQNTSEGAETAKDLFELVQQIASGKLHVQVGKIFHLNDIVEPHQRP